MSDDGPTIRIRPDGPYLVKGADLLRIRPAHDEAGRPVAWFEGEKIETEATYALCRCGASNRKPFCDGTHRDIDFDGTETADMESTMLQREAYDGDGVILTDHEELCWHAGFCSRSGTSAWKLARRDELDETERGLLVRMVHDCPSGRLEVHAPPEDEAHEPDLVARIGIVNDGPLYVQGCIPLESASGEVYDERNRMSLCRCGASTNKPFCDASHVEADFEES